MTQVGDYITFDYVLRRSNGYFVYSTTGSGSGQQEPTKFAQNFQVLNCGMPAAPRLCSLCSLPLPERSALARARGDRARGG